MGYLGQKYDKGLVIQRSPDGSAFQEDVEVTVEGEQELTPKVGGGFKKVTVYGAGGSEVIPNPEMEGDEPDLEGIEIDGDKYKIPEGINVVANPTLAGNENSLAGLQVGDTKYAVKTYLKFPTTWPTTGTTKAFLDAVNADSNAVEGNAYLGELTCSDLPTGLNNVEAIVEIIKSAVGESKAIHVTLTSGNVKPYHWERTYWDNGLGDSGWKSFLVDVTASDVNSTGIASGKVLKANGSGGASWEDDTEGTPVVANPTLAGTENDLTGLQVGNTKYAVPQGTNVVANPTLVGTEANLNGLQVGNTKYKVGGDPDIIPLLDSTNTIFDDETPVTQYGQPILIADNSEADTSYQQAFSQMIKRVVGNKFSMTPFHNESTGEDDVTVNPVFVSIPFKKPIQGFYDYEYENGHIHDGESHTYAQLRTKTNLLNICIGSGVGTGSSLTVDAINYNDYERDSLGGGLPRVLELHDYELGQTYYLSSCVGGEFEYLLWTFFNLTETSNGMWINENPLLEGNIYVTYKYTDPYSLNTELRTEKVALTAEEIQTIRYLVTAKVSKCDVHGGS